MLTSCQDFLVNNVTASIVLLVTVGYDVCVMSKKLVVDEERLAFSRFVEEQRPLRAVLDCAKRLCDYEKPFSSRYFVIQTSILLHVASCKQKIVIIKNKSFFPKVVLFKFFLN